MERCLFPGSRMTEEHSPILSYQKRTHQYTNVAQDPTFSLGYIRSLPCHRLLMGKRHDQHGGQSKCEETEHVVISILAVKGHVQDRCRFAFWSTKKPLISCQRLPVYATEIVLAASQLATPLIPKPMLSSPCRRAESTDTRKLVDLGKNRI